MQAEWTQTSRPTRRRVLQTGLGWVTASSVAEAARGADARRGSVRTLVLLHLSGGNDGLNTVIPYRDPMYYELRPGLSRVAAKAIPLSDTVALHPALSALVPVYRRGALAIVQGVGGAEPDYSHVGSCCRWGEAIARLTGGVCDAEGLPLAWPAPVPVPYRRGEIGRTLAEVADQITSPRPPEVVFATAGGFDTHADQLPRHEEVLRDLGDGLAAFLRMLGARGHAGSVLVAAWSEFGRRPAENATGGTDHGWAGPLFLLGKGVRGGLHGRSPSLSRTDSGNLIPSVDIQEVGAMLTRSGPAGFPSPIGGTW